MLPNSNVIRDETRRAGLVAPINPFTRQVIDPITQGAATKESQDALNQAVGTPSDVTADAASLATDPALALTVVSLLKALVRAVDELEPFVDNLAVTSDSINLNTDELESLSAAIRDRIGEAVESPVTYSLGDRLKGIAGVLSLVSDAVSVIQERSPVLVDGKVPVDAVFPDALDADIQVGGAEVSDSNPVPITPASGVTWTLGTGANVIGSVGQDGAWTVGVVSIPSIPTGSNVIGKVEQSGDWIVEAMLVDLGGAATDTTLQAVRDRLSNVTADYDAGGGTQLIPLQGFALPQGGGAVIGGTASNPIRFDPTGTTTQPISGVVIANLGTIGDAATDSSVQEIVAKLPGLGQQVAADSLSFVLASDAPAIPVSQSATWNINNITGTVSLPTGAAQDTTLAEVRDRLPSATADYDTGAGTQNLPLFGLALPASGGAIAGGTASNPIRFDPTGTTNQPVSVLALPLPDGAATQETLLSIDEKLPPLIDGKIPVSIEGGTVVIDSTSIEISNDIGNPIPIEAVTLPLPSGAAMDSTLADLNAKFESLGQKAMTGSTPVVLASDQSAIPASQSGTWNINNISGAISLPNGAATDTTLQAVRDRLTTVTADFDTTGGTQAIPLYGFAIPGSGGAVAGGSATNPIRFDPTGTTTQPISGTVTANLGTIGGAATETTLNSILTRLGSNGAAASSTGSEAAQLRSVYDALIAATPAGTNRIGKVGIRNASDADINPATEETLTTIAGRLTTVTLDADSGGGTQNIPVYLFGLPASGGAVAGGTSTNPLRIDPTGSTIQPVSGTITATQSDDTQFRGQVRVRDSSGNFLPTGDAVARSIHVRLSNGTTANAANAPVFVQLGDGTNAFTQIPVREKSTSGTVTSVASSASSQTLLSANTSRIGAIIINDATSAKLYIRLENATASTSNYSVCILAGQGYEIPFGYTGAITGIWSAVDGNARITEFV